MRRAGDTVGYVLRQAFMSREEYQEIREEDRVLGHLQRPLTLLGSAILFVIIIVSAAVALSIVFPGSAGRPFCSKHPIPPSGITDDSMHSYFFTEYEATQYFWVVVLVPTCIVFAVSATYLFAGMFVAYSAPNRHFCIKVVENNCCASKKGGVRCLATLNVSFAVVFGLLAFLGSTILTFETDCSVTLFWCYEMMAWSFVLLYGGTFLFLRRKAAVIMDEGEFYGSRTTGMELLEASVVPTPEMEKRVNAGFRSWMGSSMLSSDDEEEDLTTTELDDSWEATSYYNLETGRR